MKASFGPDGSWFGFADSGARCLFSLNIPSSLEALARDTQGDAIEEVSLGDNGNWAAKRASGRINFALPQDHDLTTILNCAKVGGIEVSNKPSF